MNANMKRTQVDLPKSLVKIIDETCVALNRKGEGLKITRTALLRQWIEEGLKRDRVVE